MIAVIGDLHGCYNTLLALYEKIKKKYPEIEIYSAGDLVDRGNFSYEVIKFFIDNKLKFAPGNHDYMFYAYVKQPNTLMARAWLLNGNEATLRSYLNHMNEVEAHLKFIKSMPMYYNLDDCFISHAGISIIYEINMTTISKEEKEFFDELVSNHPEDDNGILWTRDKLRNIGKLQIVGHTRQNEVKFDQRANAVYIDTGAYSGNKLSAVIVEKNQVIDVLDERTHKKDYT